MPSKQALAETRTPESVRAEIEAAEKKLAKVSARLSDLAKIERLDAKIEQKRGELDELTDKVRAASEHAYEIIAEAEREKERTLLASQEKVKLELDVVKEEAAKLREKWQRFEAESSEREKKLDIRETELRNRERLLDEKDDAIDAKAVRVLQDQDECAILSASLDERQSQLESWESVLEDQERKISEIRQMQDERAGAIEIAESEADEKIRIAESKASAASELSAKSSQLASEIESEMRKARVTLAAVDDEVKDMKRKAAELKAKERDIVQKMQRLVASRDEMDRRESILLRREANAENAERAIEKARDDIRIEWMRIQDAKRSVQS